MNVAGDRDTAAWDELPHADGASWSSNLACFPSTRGVTLSIILEWARSPDRQNVLWLRGVPRSGKSAIAHSVAQALYESGQLASCFFFDRQDRFHNTPQLLFTTIARDIASHHPTIAAEISEALEREPALGSAHFSRQFEAFISGPLRRHPIDQPIIVVIDALDETRRDGADTDLLAILRDELPKLSPSTLR